MKQSGWIMTLILVSAGLASAQTSSIDQLEKDLNQLKQQREETSSQTMSQLLDQLGAAADSPNAALDLFQKAGGDMPDAAPVDSRYEHETPTEKESRLAKDDAVTRDFAGVIQLHCGLMRFAVLFVTKPDAPNLGKDWTAWLLSSAKIYGGLSSSPKLKKVKLKDSVFNSYFNFNGWKDKEQGGWAVLELPELFRKNVINPLREAHSPDLLTAWDSYIAMRSVDQPDEDVWTAQDLPYLKFERAADDFSLTPNAGKLAVLVDLIKNNPSNPKVDDMISRTKKMMQDFRGETPTTNAPPAADVDPRSSVPAASPTPANPSEATTNAASPGADAPVIRP